MKKPATPIPLPVLLLIIGIIMPIELSPIIGTLHLLPHRCAILIFIIPALKRLFTQQRMRFQPYDLLFILYSCWIIFVFPLHMDVQPGLQYGGSLAVESLGGYIIARAYIRDYETFRATLNGLFVSVCFVGLLALPEAITGNHYIHLWLRFTGGVAPEAHDEVRWGLSRSYATFNHPILYGAFCASLLSMIWFTEKSTGTRIGKAAALFGATFLGLSSAPLNTLVVQSALGGVHRATKRFPNRVKMLGMAFVILYIMLAIFTDQSPLASIITRITIDPWTAYYRTLIWTFGMDNVWAHPWIGLGLDDWKRPEWMHSDSVDSYWLIVAMQMGLPAITLLIAAIWLLIAAVHKRGPGKRPLQEQRAAIGWTLSFTAFTLAGFTVHYWDSTHTYLFFLLGMSGWLADPLRVKSKAMAKASAGAKGATSGKPKRTRAPAPGPMPEPAYLAKYVEGLDPLAAR